MIAFRRANGTHVVVFPHQICFLVPVDPAKRELEIVNSLEELEKPRSQYTVLQSQTEIVSAGGTVTVLGTPAQIANAIMEAAKKSSPYDEMVNAGIRKVLDEQKGDQNV